MCKTCEMCEKAADRYLSALEWVPDWFVISEMVKDLDNNDLDIIELDKPTTWYNKYKQRKNER